MVDPALLEILIQDAQVEGDQEKLNRLLTLADELRASSQQAPQGFMAGRMYIPPSPWQGASRMVNAGVSALGEHRANQLRGQQTAARGQMRQDLLAALLRQQGGAANPTVPAATVPGVQTPWAGR